MTIDVTRGFRKACLPLVAAKAIPGWALYVLEDPRDGRPFYVGLTRNISQRMAWHLSVASPCRPIIAEMIVEGAVPLVRWRRFRDPARAAMAERLAILVVSAQNPDKSANKKHGAEFQWRHHGTYTRQGREQYIASRLAACSRQLKRLICG